MNEKQQVYREILWLSLGELVAAGVMVGVFALLGKFSGKVLFGALLGAAVSCLNYLLMAVFVNLAADKAEQGNVAGGRGLMTLSMFLRYALMLGTLALGVLVLKLHPLATTLPLIFAHLLLLLGEAFRKAGEKKG